MRDSGVHETVYRYGQPARGVIQTLRLTPRNHEANTCSIGIDVSENCRGRPARGRLRQTSHVFNVDGPLSELRILAEARSTPMTPNGVVRGGIERFPPSLYLRKRR